MKRDYNVFVSVFPLLAEVKQTDYFNVRAVNIYIASKCVPWISVDFISSIGFAFG